MKRVIIVGLCLLFCSFSFSPMSTSIRLNRGDSQATFELLNSSDSSLPVIISVHERRQKEDGREEIPETDKLSVFPPQLILPSGERRSIRVRYNGEKPEKELSFRVVAEQAPVNVDGEDQSGVGIQMLLRYEAALYVNPGGVKPNLKLDSFEKNGDEFKFVLKNTGTSHQILRNPRIRFNKEETTHLLDASMLESLDGQNVLAGSTRIFKVKSELAVDESFSAEIRVD